MNLLRLVNQELQTLTLVDVYFLQLAKGSVEFKDVVFQYEPNRDVLQGVSFKAQGGTTIAFGKTVPTPIGSHVAGSWGAPCVIAPPVLSSPVSRPLLASVPMSQPPGACQHLRYNPPFTPCTCGRLLSLPCKQGCSPPPIPFCSRHPVHVPQSQSSGRC